MGAGAVPVVLTFLVLLLALRMVYASNKALVRSSAWGELGRRLFPFVAIIAMAASLPLLQGRQEAWMPLAWGLAFGAVLLVSNYLSRPLDERRASRAFRDGDYVGAASLYRRLVERHPLARYWTFLGAALANAGQHEEAVDASTRAVELDPKYGLAYYNRALSLRALGRKSRVAKDLRRAVDADLPHRFKRAAKGMLEGL